MGRKLPRKEASPVPKLCRLTLLAAVFAALATASASASAAPRMWVGFQDDPNFRWNPNRVQAFDQAQQANATIVRTTVYWSKIAPARPANAVDSFDPAYRFDDLDEFVRNAQLHGMEVMLTIWGTPDWANGGKGQNRVPDNYGDLTAFATAVASRYNGTHPGMPFVRYYGVWNESNLNQFL